jgi:triphosphoribosyl-dephospho-CoA synthase
MKTLHDAEPDVKLASRGDAPGIAAMAQLACLLEVSAPKPGNVSPGRHFADTRYEHFLASAAAIGGPLAGVATRPIGETIRLAIEATARVAPANTNLGIVLLSTPIARAAADAGAATARELRMAVERVLERTTVADARDVYAAIRRASPGGLGRAETQDVTEEPTASLLDVMRLAAHRDGVAREYATGFQVTFETALPALAGARRDDLSWDDAIVETFLTILAASPDTHVTRRGGADLANAVSRRATDALAAGGTRSGPGRRAIAEMDTALRDPRNTANPGTTADLTAAAIFAFLLTGGWDTVRLKADSAP